MPITAYPNGMLAGVTIRGMPVNMMFPGNVFFLNNSSVLGLYGVTGSDTNAGDYAHPFATLQGALNSVNVVAGRGDIICVMPGHAETVSNATALALNKSGVLILGIGSGKLRPTFTLDTANTSTIAVSAANMAMVNCKFKANFASIAALFTLSATDFTLDNCEFADNSSVLNFVNIVKVTSGANTADALTVQNCQWQGLGAASNTCLLNTASAINNLIIKNNYVKHAATTGGGLMQIGSTGTPLMTNLQIDGNKINLANTASPAIMIGNAGANTGYITNNQVKGAFNTSVALVTLGMGFEFSNNYYQFTADKSGFLLPAVDTAA